MGAQTTARALARIQALLRLFFSWMALAAAALLVTGATACSSSSSATDGGAGTTGDASPGDAASADGGPAGDAGPGDAAPGEASAGDAGRDSGTTADASASDAQATSDGPQGGDGGGTGAEGGTGAVYLCGSPPPSATPDDAGATQIIANIGSQGSPYVNGVWRSGDRLLASQVDWTLWDLSTRALVASGPGAVTALAGGVFLVEIGTDPIYQHYTYELRAVSDGSLMATEPLTTNTGGYGAPPPSGIATDGSYFWLDYGYLDASFVQHYVLQTFSLAGVPIVTWPGNYTHASIVAVPGELRVAFGPAGNTVIEHVSATTPGSTTSPPFSGTFQRWFADGSRFVSTVGTTNLFVYDASATKLALFAVPTLGQLAADFGGGGDFVFNHVDGKGTDVYQIGGNGQPAASYASGPAWSGSTLFFGPSNDVLTVVQLGSTLASTSVTLPHPIGYVAAFGADSGGDFGVASSRGSLYFQGTSQSPSASGMLGCGNVVSLAGSTAGTAAVAMASGNLFVVDVPSSAVKADLGIAADEVALSADGKTLGVLEASDVTGARKLDIVALPGGAIQHTFTGTAVPLDFSLSADGTTLARRFASATDVTDPSGTTSLLTITGALGKPPALSPSGKYVAATVLGNQTASTNLYANGTLVNAMNGDAFGWADDNHVFVQLPPFRGTAGATTIYDNRGNSLATPAFPIVTGLSPVNATTIYVSDDGNLYDLTTAKVIASTSLPGGVVAGARVLALEGASLVSKAY
jgi:hypothetical protein